jgi:glycosyltransferase involved in cell wall biosynthesis
VANVSIYIPAYNASEFLARSIESILAQTLAPDEILVIDDGSEDSTAEIASRYSRVMLVRHEKNRGLAAARNTALQLARNELVASIDADCVADSAWLATLVSHMDDSKLAGVGGRLIEGVRRSVADRWRSAHMPQEWGPQPIRNPMFLFGANNLFRKSAILGVGGYDESMRINGEDADLCRRLRAQGWELAYDPTAKATHMRHDSVHSVLDAYWRWLFFGRPDSPNKISLPLIIRHAFLGNIRYLFYGLIKSDLEAGQFELTGLDLLTLFYFPYRDLRMWLALRRNLAKTDEDRYSEE